MTSLDKDTMSYFYDELEKTALLGRLARGTLDMVARAARGAGRATMDATKGLNKFYTKNLSAKAIAEGGKEHLGHQIGAGLLTAGTIGTGLYAGKKSIDAYKKNQQQNKQFGPIRQAGVQEL